MLITSDELIERKIHLKTWLHELQVGGRAENAPSFPLSGPVTLPTRKRKSAMPRPRPGEAAMVTSRHPYMGGEKFKLTGVSSEKNRDDAFLINVVMTPATTDLAAQGISGMTLPLEDAMRYFDGLTAFAERALKSAVGITPGIEHSGAPKRKAITKEEVAESWGTW